MSTPSGPQPVTGTANDALANAAVAGVRSGMVLGLGTGRAAARGIRALADRVQRERLEITGVATSLASAELARSLGLRVVELNDVDRINLLFDGADEVDPHLAMIKGGGGAMTRERIVADAALASGGRCIYMIDDSKQSRRLGERRLLPIEVLPMAERSVCEWLTTLGFTVPISGALRRTLDGKPFKTDNHALVLDMHMPAALPADGSDHLDALRALAGNIKALPGVIDHGLFVDECSTMLIESAAGVETRHRR